MFSSPSSIDAILPKAYAPSTDPALASDLADSLTPEPPAPKAPAIPPGVPPPPPNPPRLAPS